MKRRIISTLMMIFILIAIVSVPVLADTDPTPTPAPTTPTPAPATPTPAPATPSPAPAATPAPATPTPAPAPVTVTVNGLEQSFATFPAVVHITGTVKFPASTNELTVYVNDVKQPVISNTAVSATPSPYDITYTAAAPGLFIVRAVAVDKVGNFTAEATALMKLAYKDVKKQPKVNPANCPAAPAVASKLLSQAKVKTAYKGGNYISDVTKAMTKKGDFPLYSNGKISAATLVAYIPKTSVDAYKLAVKEFLTIKGAFNKPVPSPTPTLAPGATPAPSPSPTPTPEGKGNGKGKK